MADAYLAGLVDEVNRGGPERRVRLLVGGRIVTGTLISQEAYHQALQAQGGEKVIAYAEDAARQAVTYRDGLAEPRKLTSAALRDAEVEDVGPVGLWRVVLEHVVGFTLLPSS